MRLTYYGETTEKARTAVFTWSSQEHENARRIIRTLSLSWNILSYPAIAYISVENRQQFDQLMKEYQAIKSNL